VSLFTLHVLWPFLWIWATLYRPERGWGMQSHVSGGSELQLHQRVEALERELKRMQTRAGE